MKLKVNSLHINSTQFRSLNIEPISPCITVLLNGPSRACPLAAVDGLLRDGTTFKEMLHEHDELLRKSGPSV